MGWSYTSASLCDLYLYLTKIIILYKFKLREHLSGKQIASHHATAAIYFRSEGFIQSAAEDFQAV
jgi:hypothetical protein